MRHSRGRRTAAAAVATLALGTLAGCGGGETGPPSLTWYINPDSGGQVELAKRCTEASGGRYTIDTEVLPREASGQREQLVRRLAVGDSSIDLISLDPPFVAEFAEAGFLAPVPDDVAQRVTEDVVDPLVAAATWRDELVAVPWWANTQLLWYRKSWADAAGLDMTRPVTWSQLIEAATSQGKLAGVQGARAESLTVFLNALVESAGGQILLDSEAQPEDVQVGLADEPAVRAAEVLRQVADSGAAGAALSTQDEDATATGFEGPDAGFMVNWPFVWSRVLGKAETGAVDPSVPEDYGWALYPQVVEGEDSRPPLGGIVFGVGAFSENPDLAFEATECITTVENEAYYMVTNGNPAGKAAVYDDPAVQEAFPMADVIRDSLEQAAPRPQTPYYNEVTGGIQRTYHPPAAVTPGATGQEATELIQAVLRKEELL